MQRTSRWCLMALTVAAPALAQGAADHVAVGDRLFAARDAHGDAAGVRAGARLRPYELRRTGQSVTKRAACGGVRTRRRGAPYALCDGALRVLGVSDAEIMRLNGMLRFAARQFLGGKRFDPASWGKAQRFLELAVAAVTDYNDPQYQQQAATVRRTM